MMTDDERTAHRKKLQSFKTLAECEAYDKQHQAEMETRAKAQHKTLRESSGAACNRYKVAAAPARRLPTACRQGRAQVKSVAQAVAAATRVFVEARTATSRPACCVSYQARQSRIAAATATRSAISASQRLRTRCAATNSRIAVSDAAGGLLRRW